MPTTGSPWDFSKLAAAGWPDKCRQAGISQADCDYLGSWPAIYLVPEWAAMVVGLPHSAELAAKQFAVTTEPLTSELRRILYGVADRIAPHTAPAGVSADSWAAALEEAEKRNPSTWDDLYALSLAALGITPEEGATAPPIPPTGPANGQGGGGGLLLALLILGGLWAATRGR